MPDSPPIKQVMPRAPTLYAIIAIKLLKGLFFLIAAWVVYAYSDNNLPAEYQSLLRWLKLNPDGKFWTNLAVQVDDLTAAKMVHVAIGTFIYALFAVVEGVGLMFRWPWAGWLSIGESAFFIPIEVYELSRRFNWYIVTILVLNAFMVWYLFSNRERLFRHHHH